MFLLDPLLLHTLLLVPVLGEVGTALHNLATEVTGKGSGVGQVRADGVGHLRGDAGKVGVWPSGGIPVGECSGIHHCYGGLARRTHLQEAGISRWSVTVSMNLRVRFLEYCKEIYYLLIV